MRFFKKLVAVLTGRSTSPRPFKLPAKPYGEARSFPEQLDSLCQALNCTYERERHGDQVSLALVFPNGERLVGQGNTTYEAFTAVSKRAKGLYVV